MEAELDHRECAWQMIRVHLTNVVAGQRQLLKVFEPQQVRINFCYLRENKHHNELQ